MKRLSALLLLALCTLAATAQTYTVSGHLYERGDTLTPLPLCTVELLRAADSARVDACTSGNNGLFQLSSEQAGRYAVRASFIGYTPIVRSVSLTKAKPHVDLGQLIMHDTAERLGEAQVTALSRQLTIKADTFVYHASGFQLPTGATLAALLKQLPGLEMGSDGSLTFQGKAVSSILVNGKDFFGDNETALANLPAEAVNDVKAYEKTSEENAFKKSVDNDKQTVVDLQIKKEWLGAWNVNLEAAGGTDDRYNLRGFVSTFTDRRRIAVFGSVNDISEAQVVDENGNWSNYGSTSGMFTYRRVGVLYSYDNGRRDGTAGAFKGNFDVSYRHNDYIYDRLDNAVNLLTDASAQYSYAHNYTTSRLRDINASGGLTWTPDTLNLLRINAVFNYYDQSEPLTQRRSVFTNEHKERDAYTTLLSTTDTIGGVYSLQNSKLETSDHRNESLTATYIRRFHKQGRSLTLYGNAYETRNSSDSDYLTAYRYFNPEATQRQLVNRQYDDNNDDHQSYKFSVAYEEPLSKALRWSFGYEFSHERKYSRRYLWQLDRALGFDDTALPVGVRPVLADSLLNDDNSLRYTQFWNRHEAHFSLQGQWQHFEFSVLGTAHRHHEKLRYERGGNTYQPSETYNGFEPQLYASYKPVDGTSYNLSYNGTRSYEGLLNRLPITDDADPMAVTVSNPNLRHAWTNNIRFGINRFNKKHGNNHSLWLYLTQTSNAAVETQQVDAVTGRRTTSRANVNGNYSLAIYNTNFLTLDLARQWSLLIMPHFYTSRKHQYVGTIGDEWGFSILNNYNTMLEARLSYRQGILNISAGGAWTVQALRYKNASIMDETGHQYELSLSPQVTLPFGLKVNTNLTLWGRLNYSDAILNHPQWLLNLSVEQAFLKKKSLVVRLEGVDVFHERTAEYSYGTATGRYYMSVKCFPAYWMLHVVYRFNTKR